MQVTIGKTIAEMSDDGRDIHFPAPPATGRVLTLPFPSASRAGKPSAASTTAASTVKTDVPGLVVQLQGPAGAALVLCAVVAAVAMKQFAGRDAGRGEAPSQAYATLDDAAFLKRYARTP